MPGENIQDWSTTAANNDDADTSINWLEGQARATVNDSARSMMAAVAKDRNLKNGSITTGGTANAQTFSSGLSYTSVPTGLRVKLKIGTSLTNTDTATLNMDGIGGVTVKNQRGDNLLPGELLAGAYADFVYNGTNWILVGPLPAVMLLSKQSASASAQIDFTGLVDEYTYYKFVITGLIPAADEAYLMMRFSTDNGSTFLSTGTYAANHIAYAASAGSGTASVSVISGATAIQVSLPNDTSATQPGHVTIDAFGFGGTAQGYIIGKNVNYQADSEGTGFFETMGNNVSTTAFNAVRFLMSTGNIASGTFAMYGYR